MLRLYTYILLFAMAAADAHAAGNAIGPAPAVVERVIDGDTVRMRVAIWIDQELVVSIRLAGVDAPELFRPQCTDERDKAELAKRFVEDFLKGSDATLHDIGRDKYGGRVVARIETQDGDLSTALVEEGLAVRSDKGVWCQ
ncbi:MAG: thermonuclease family protein [Pseudomonadota bacterium]